MARIFKQGRLWGIDFNDSEGVRHRKLIAPSKRVAEEALCDTLNKIAREEILGVVAETATPFASFADEWGNKILPTVSKRTRERWSGIVQDHLKPAFRGTLRAINLEAVENYIASRLELKPCKVCSAKRKPDAICWRCSEAGEVADASPATVRAELTVLRHILKRAVLWKKLSRYPLEHLVVPKAPPGRVRWLTNEEITRLLAACAIKGGHVFTKVYLRAFIQVALNSGMRRNEVLGLKRVDVDWENGLANLPVTKNGEVGHAPLNSTAVAALKALPIRIDGRFFPFDPNRMSVAFQRVARRAGIENFHLHDLRHTFASHHAMNGTQQRSLQELMRHKDPRMTVRYEHLSRAYLTETINRVQLGADPVVQTPRATA